MTSGKPVPVTIRNPKAGKDLQSAIDEGFATGTLKKHQTALNTSRRVVNIRGGHHRVNEEIRAPGVDIRSAKGNYIVKAGAISVTGNSGTISIPGARVDNAKFGGFSGNLRFNGTGNNWDFRNAAFTVTGTGTPDLYGANTGNTMVNGKSFGGLVAAAAHNATNEHFGPTHSLSNFTMPSRRALQHAASAHVVLGSTPATFSHLSASAARHIQAEMHMNYGSSRVKPPELNYN
ncbi:MAG: hypothetical protein EB059_02680 [Alphaproteobacteria bacterium]|nr:hypothetical protein [Alphaproteobacteria bacterium]